MALGQLWIHGLSLYVALPAALALGVLLGVVSVRHLDHIALGAAGGVGHGAALIDLYHGPALYCTQAVTTRTPMLCSSRPARHRATMI
jgi:hypothetical protein